MLANSVRKKIKVPVQHAPGPTHPPKTHTSQIAARPVDAASTKRCGGPSPAYGAPHLQRDAKTDVEVSV